MIRDKMKLTLRVKLKIICTLANVIQCWLTVVSHVSGICVHDTHAVQSFVMYPVWSGVTILLVHPVGGFEGSRTACRESRVS